MSRMTDLLRRVEQQNPALAKDLASEVKALAARRSFGLNFERHIPETVELPHRRIRRGDKVRFRAPRGDSGKGLDTRTWLVTRIERQGEMRTAHLIEHRASDKPETAQRLIEDLVVVAEFRDPIYPGLKSTGKVERGGDKPFHTVINAENYHALEALLFAYEGKVDCIYIDPPYNSGARDWKYNNDYVDSEDAYRHSKWLAMMERRLRLAKRLLNPGNSVLICAIDDKEVHRAAMLAEQIFGGARIQAVTSVVNPRGVYREGEFSRCHEYLLFVIFGDARVIGEPDDDFSEGAVMGWRTLRRSDLTSARGTSKGGKNQFYPIYVDDKTGRIEYIGKPLSHHETRNSVPAIAGCRAVFPIRKDGVEMNWGLTPNSLQRLLDEGFVKVGEYTPNEPQQYQISYLTSGRVNDIKIGRAKVLRYDATGTAVVQYISSKMRMPLTSWAKPSHNAETGGTNLVKILLGDKRFPFPKSLYAVEDALRLFTADKMEALILDFFAGSGTTAHAVARLNRQDGGRRRSIMVTNNEVSSDEEATLRRQGLRPGDPAWEAMGVCEHITKPRIKAAFTGRTLEGEPIKGDYKFTDEFPMSDGFDENAEFFDLTYEDPERVRHDLAFTAIAPLLWMKAGSQGRRIATTSDTFDIADTYGVLFNLDSASGFVKAVATADDLRVGYIITDDEKQYQMIADQLPRKVQPVRLYESYLRSFQINAGED